MPGSTCSTYLKPYTASNYIEYGNNLSDSLPQLKASSHQVKTVISLLWLGRCNWI